MELLILGWLSCLSVVFILLSIWLKYRGPTEIEFTHVEIERYAPHSSLPEFRKGFSDYETGNSFPRGCDFWDTPACIAYDRGIDCAIARKMNWRLNWPEHVNRT